MKAALYLRVSTRDKGQTTDNQLAQLRAWCEHKGHDIVEVYRDEESGRKGRAERRGFDRMFTDARRGRFGLVVFWALDRFSREGTAQTIHYLRTLDEYGVRFHSHTEEYLATDNELVRDLLLTILSHFARLESERLSERTKAGMERARRQGTKLGRPSKVDVALPVVRAAQEAGEELTRAQLAGRVERETGTAVSKKTISRARKRLEEKVATEEQAATAAL